MEKYSNVTEHIGPRKREAVKVSPVPETYTGSKGVIKKRIGEEVGNIETLLGDAYDTISFLMTTNRILYALATDGKTQEQIDTIISSFDGEPVASGTNKRQFFEYAIDKFKNTTTSADLDFAVAPTEKIDELIDTQGKVGQIMKEEKGL